MERTKALVRPDTFALITDEEKLESLSRFCQAASRTGMVPAHFRGKPDDLMVAMLWAETLNIPALAAIGKIFVVKGNAGFATSLLIALVNERGPFAGLIDWIVEGEPGESTTTGMQRVVAGTLKVTAHATLPPRAVTDATAHAHHTDAKIVETTISLADAIRAGWTKRGREGQNPSKYEEMPAQMLRWRTAKRLIDLYCPQVTLGVLTYEELIDEDAAGHLREPRDVEVENARLGELNADLAASAKTEPHPLITPEGGVMRGAGTAEIPDAETSDPTIPERPEDACAREGCGLSARVHGHGETGREDSHPFEPPPEAAEGPTPDEEEAPFTPEEIARMDANLQRENAKENGDG